MGRSCSSTVFRKTRQHDQRQIDRAVRSARNCARATTTDRPPGFTRGRCDDWPPHPLGAPQGPRLTILRGLPIRESLAFGKALYDRRTRPWPEASPTWPGERGMTGRRGRVHRRRRHRAQPSPCYGAWAARTRRRRAPHRRPRPSAPSGSKTHARLTHPQPRLAL